MAHLLRLASTHARLCLIAGLLAGLLLPNLAALMVPWLPHMVALLMTVTALRVGHVTAFGAVRDLGAGLAQVCVLQLVLPLLAIALLYAANLHETPAGMAILLVTAAPTITGSVNLALLLKQDAGRMMQLLVLGTAAFPLTVLPVLYLMPQLGTLTDVSLAGGRLALVIAASAAVGFALRARLYPDPTPQQTRTLDGLSVLTFAVIAVGLMAAFTPNLIANPLQTAGWTLLAFALCFGLQLAVLLMGRAPLAIAAGTRNIAIFLVALPADVMAPLMIFVACWQLPMYLTPILLPRLYTWALPDD